MIISLRKQLVKEDNNHNKVLRLKIGSDLDLTKNTFQAIIIRALTTFATLIENNRTDILVDFITQVSI